LSDENFFSTVKQATSDYQQVANHTTVNNGSSLDCVVQPRISWILSSVDNFSDEQLDSRFGETEVRDDIDKQLAIFEKQQEEEWNKGVAGELDDDIKVCRCMWDIIESGGLCEIRIPFVKAITWNDIKRPRSFPFFKDFVRCFTLFRIKQREKVRGFYMATIQDFEDAKTMYKKMEHINATKLNTKEIAVISYLKDQHQNFLEAMKAGNCSQSSYTNVGKVSRSDLVGVLAKTHKMTQQNLIYIIHGKNDKGGLLNKIPGLQAERITNNVFGGSTDGGIGMLAT
jgi:hypothetical protein